MTGDGITNEHLRKALNEHNFGHANCSVNDRNFGHEISKSPPDGYPAGSEWEAIATDKPKITVPAQTEYRQRVQVDLTKLSPKIDRGLTERIPNPN